MNQATTDGETTDSGDQPNMSVETGEVSDMSVLLGIATLAETSVRNRRSYEWQVNFSVWTLIAATTATTVHRNVGQSFWILMGLGYFSLILIYGFWTWMVQSSHSVDRRLKNEAIQKLSQNFGLQNAESQVPGFLWGAVFVAFTILLMVLSAVFIFISQPH